VPERLAVFGGPYGNPRAVRAVLDDLAARGEREAWCLGDLGGFGPDPEGCAAILRARDVPMLQGNYDHSIGHGLADCACGYEDPQDVAWAEVAYAHTAARTGEATREWLRGLPATARLERGGRRVLLCHGSPRRVNEFLWESTCSVAFLAWLCDAHEADVVVCSHTGLHWHRALPGGRHVINCGAVGRPAHDGRPGAWYASIGFGEAGPDVEFRHVAYDHAAAAAELRAAGLPDAFAETLLGGWWTTCLEVLPARERSRQRTTATRHAAVPEGDTIRAR
jgi:diadenosine tetraphosphatase ApaH/serine/threonine PP2A family protein phosphatase